MNIVSEAATYISTFLGASKNVHLRELIANAYLLFLKTFLLTCLHSFFFFFFRGKLITLKKYFSSS